MSAETLRRAADKMRAHAERAQLANGDEPWAFDGIGWNDVQGTTYTVKAGPLVVAEAGIEESADYIATMHPGVGLALADWLDTAGADLWAHGPLCGCGSGCHDCDDDLWQPHVRRALDVARLILGGA